MPANETPPTSVELPERVGRYPVTGVLGKGAMGIVYRASDPVIRRPVAIKAIRKELLSDAEQADSVLARFRNEVQAVGSLVHPGIVSVYEYGEDGGLAYIVMECVEGNSLREYIDRTVHFAVADAVSIAAQLLDALHYAHERGVWHRDVKPSNLKITEDGRLKVLDFGIARIESSNLTQVGMLMGTHGFIAPEQYLGTYVDHRADVFAAGVILYQLLAGVMPFRGSRESVMYQVCNTTPRPPSEAGGRPEIEAFDPVVARALATRPEDRFVSCGLFRDALLEAYDAPVNATVSEQAIIRQALPSLQRPYTTPSTPLRTSPPRTAGAPPAPAAMLGTAPTRPGLQAPRSSPYDRIEPAPLPADLAAQRSPKVAADSMRLDQMRLHLDRLAALRPQLPASRDRPHLVDVEHNLARLIASRAAPPEGTETVMLDQIGRALAAMVAPRATPAPGPEATAAATEPGLAPTEPPAPLALRAVEPAVAVVATEGGGTTPIRPQAAPAPLPAPAATPGDDDETLIDLKRSSTRSPSQTAARLAITSQEPTAPQQPPPAPAPTVGTAPQAIALLDQLTAEDRQLAVRALTHYLGPIARIIADRVARGTTSRSAFLSQLAEHLSDPAERSRFLAEAGGGMPR